MFVGTCMCVRLHVCSEWDSMLCHRHQEAQLGCLAVAPLYLCSCLCLCVCVRASVYHGDVDVSLQQIYLPVHLRVIMRAYFCMCATLYAIWSLGVSFFSICSSRLWRKADPLGRIGSKVLWLRICQLGVRVAITRYISLHRRLSEGFIKIVACVYCSASMLDGCGFLCISYRSWEADTRTNHFPCLYGTKQPHMSGFCVVHTQW